MMPVPREPQNQSSPWGYKEVKKGKPTEEKETGEPNRQSRSRGERIWGYNKRKGKNIWSRVGGRGAGLTRRTLAKLVRGPKLSGKITVSFQDMCKEASKGEKQDKKCLKRGRGGTSVAKSTLKTAWPWLRKIKQSRKERPVGRRKETSQNLTSLQK